MDSQAVKSKQSMQSSLISLILTVDKKKATCDGKSYKIRDHEPREDFQYTMLDVQCFFYRGKPWTCKMLQKVVPRFGNAICAF